jgi:glycosyltransferase involved in cell wall biosynthesis
LRKVAYILTPIEFGGSEKVNLTFLRNVNRVEYDIHPILLVRPWEEDNYFMQSILQEKYDISRIPVAQKPLNAGRDYLRIARCILYLYRILSFQKYQLVHTHGYFADIIASPLCKYLRIPHISTCHGFISNNDKLKLYNALDRLVLRFCDKIITVSSEIMNDLVEKSGVNDSKIVVIQNAVQCCRNENVFISNRAEKRRSFLIGDDEFVIGYVGRLSEEKGVRFLIEAGYALKKKSESFRILIIGNGPIKGELEKLTILRGLEKEIDFVGFQNTIENWLPALDLFVLPSLTEGTPLALLEAMSMGIPVIASSVGGVPMVIENEVDGFLVKPTDVEDLTKKILHLKNDSELRNNVAKKGANKITEQYNVNKWCLKIEEQYNLIIDYYNNRVRMI